MWLHASLCVRLWTLASKLVEGRNAYICLIALMYVRNGRLCACVLLRKYVSRKEQNWLLPDYPYSSISCMTASMPCHCCLYVQTQGDAKYML
jgi:hypothetical protein